MHILKLILISVIFFGAVLTGMSLLMPNTVVTNESVQVARSQKDIMQKVGDLSTWTQWHPALKNVPVKVSNPSSGVKASITWQQEGKENQLLITETDSSFIRFLIKRKGEKDIDNFISVAPLTNSPQMNIEWRVIHTIKWYPWEKFGAMTIGQTERPALKLALDSLKAHL